MKPIRRKLYLGILDYRQNFISKQVKLMTKISKKKRSIREVAHLTLLCAMANFLFLVSN